MFSFKNKPKSELLLPDGIAANVGRALLNDVREQGGDDKVMEKFMENFPLRRQIAQEIMDKLGEGKRSSLAIVPDCMFEYTDKEGGKYKFEIIETVLQSVFDVHNLESISCERWYDTESEYQYPSVLRKRAISRKGNLGLADALFILDHEEHLLMKYRTNIFLFPGTLMCDRDGGMRIPVIFWSKTKICWALNFFMIDETVKFKHIRFFRNKS